MILLNIQRSRIFPKLEEKIFLALPVIFIAPIIYELLNPLSWSTVQIAIFRGFAASLFLNTTHVGMTIALMVAFPRVAEWRQQRFGRWAVHSKAVTVGLFAVLLLFYFSALGILPSPFMDPVLWQTTVLMGHAFLLDWHGIGQSKGLTLIYNHRFKEHGDVDPASFGFLKNLAFFERMLPPAFLVASFGFQFNKIFNWNWPYANVFLILTYVLMGLMFLIPFLVPAPSRLNKIIFNFRFLLWPLALTNVMASVALAVIHGFEYLFVYRQIFRENKWGGESLRKNALLLTLVICGGVFVLSIFQMDGFAAVLVEQYHVSSVYFRMVTAGLLAFGVIHCVWDRMFFRFSNELGREFIAPLVLGEKKAGERPS